MHNKYNKLAGLIIISNLSMLMVDELLGPPYEALSEATTTLISERAYSVYHQLPQQHNELKRFLSSVRLDSSFDNLKDDRVSYSFQNYNEIGCF